ncbi:MAG: family 10 glycosylhydrolase [Oculatellaceae cyanobacterium Prado106]|nr:family 10 glycosylhydrolase [Oculatellaceae cyanobacterium Prado106]
MPQLTILQDTFFKKSTAQLSKLGNADKFAVKAGQTFEVVYAYPVADHILVRAKQRIGSVGKLGYFFAPRVRVQTEEIRGVWITNTDSEILRSPTALREALPRLKALGINTLYPVVWQRGYTLYPSEVARQFMGTAVMPNSPYERRDMLQELIQLAAPMGFRIIPWFEYGLMVSPDTPIDRQRSPLITLARNGSKFRIRSTTGRPDANIWMNPCHPDVQKFLVDLIAEVVSQYAIDGIQLDDHFAFPQELGYDRFTQDLYRSENRTRTVPLNHTDPAWTRWACSKMTNLLTRIFRAVKAKDWDCMISISPNPLTFSIQQSMADWRTWEQIGLVDELVLQVYRDSLTQFTSELEKLEVKQVRDRRPVIAGVMTGQSDWVIESSLIRASIRAARLRNYAGSACFFYETLFHHKLVPQRVVRNQNELQSLFT